MPQHTRFAKVVEHFFRGLQRPFTNFAEIYEFFGHPLARYRTLFEDPALKVYARDLYLVCAEVKDSIMLGIFPKMTVVFVTLSDDHHHQFLLRR